MPIYYQSEIVDDSEPEREEMRRRQKSAKRVDLRHMETSRTLRTPMEVIEITDDESEIADINVERRYTPPHKSLGKTAHDKDLPRSIEMLASGASPARRTRTTPTSNIPPTNTLNDAQSDHEDEDANIKFARFAYSGATSSKGLPKKPGLSRQGSSASSTTDPKPSLKKKLAHRFAADFSDFELGKLAKCVSCEVHWTARKSATQKMLHIQSCAKKNSFSDETIRIFIRKEIDSYTPTTASSKGKGKADAFLSVDPKTFLEEVVAESVPRKKGRRLETRETVKSIAQTRDLILDRARSVIGTTSSAVEAQDFSLHTQAVEVRNSGLNSAILPSTQAFGRSALAQKHHQTTNCLFSSESQETFDSEEKDGDVPSIAATFAPSKLGAICQPVQALHEDLQSAVHGSSVPSHLDEVSVQAALPVNCIPDSFRTASPITISDASSRELSPHVALRAKKSTERLHVSPPRTRSSILEREDQMFYNRSNQSIEFGWHNEDAHLHFDPGHDDLVLAEESAAPPIFSTPPPPVVRHAIAAISPRSRTPKGSLTKIKGVVPAVSSPGKKVKAPERSKASSKKQVQVEDEPDDVWERNMKEKIMRDTSLHLRVLRYEPIHFDKFLQVAADGSYCSGKLKLRLRSFLDKQAIHFYGAEPIVRGRRQ